MQDEELGTYPEATGKSGQDMERDRIRTAL
jgi:hypothetical protein